MSLERHAEPVRRARDESCGVLFLQACALRTTAQSARLRYAALHRLRRSTGCGFPVPENIKSVERQAAGFGLLATDCGAFYDPASDANWPHPKHVNDNLCSLQVVVHHRLSDRTEAMHRIEHVQQVTSVAREAIRCRHHRHVAGIERADRALELRPLGRRGAGLLVLDFHAAGSEEPGDLLGEVLPVGGDARIAVYHPTIVHRIYASRKRPDFRRSRHDAELVSFASGARNAGV